jgi:hypothetical protein
VEELSPLTQYYLRKLLNQAVEPHHRKTIDLVKSKGVEPELRRELETLARHYQTLETQLAYQNENLIDVKRRIFRILGLTMDPLLPSAIPTVVPEPIQSLFRFFQHGHICEGMHFDQDVYGLIRQYGLVQRQHAYQVAWALTDQKVPFILTVSEVRYSIWVCLRSPTYAVLMHQGLSVLDRVVALHSILGGFKDAVYIHA